MLLIETTIFYLLLGVAVATTVYLRASSSGGVAFALQVVSACLFWPLFVPMLLAPVVEPPATGANSAEADRRHQDSLAAAISQVETELDRALDGLDGWAEDVLNSEQHRLEELRAAWKAQADRIRQIDHLLAEPSSGADSLADVAADIASARQSERTRQENIRQLSVLRN